MRHSRSPPPHTRSTSPSFPMKQAGQASFRTIGAMREDSAGLGFGPMFVAPSYPLPQYNPMGQSVLYHTMSTVPVLVPMKTMQLPGASFLPVHEFAKGPILPGFTEQIPMHEAADPASHYGSTSPVPTRFMPSATNDSSRAPGTPTTASSRQNAPMPGPSGPASDRKKYVLIPNGQDSPPSGTSQPMANSSSTLPDLDGPTPGSPEPSYSQQNRDRESKAPSQSRGKRSQPSKHRSSRSPPPPPVASSSPFPGQGPSSFQPSLISGSPASRPSPMQAAPSVIRTERYIPIEFTAPPSSPPDPNSNGLIYFIDLPAPIQSPPHRVQRLNSDSSIILRPRPGPQQPTHFSQPIPHSSTRAKRSDDDPSVDERIQARLPPDVQSYMQEVHFQPHQVVCAPTNGDINYSAYANESFRGEDVAFWVERIYAIVKDSYKSEKLQRPAELLSFLYLGDVAHAKAVPMLMSMGISAVLNCAPKMALTTRDNYPAHFIFQAIQAEDAVDYKLLQHHLDEACHFIDQARCGGRRILVHCFAGINRSATLCIAYLMVYMRWTLLNAVRHVYNARPIILSNRGFMAELVLLAQSLRLLDEAHPEITLRA